MDSERRGGREEEAPSGMKKEDGGTQEPSPARAATWVRPPDPEASPAGGDCPGCQCQAVVQRGPRTDAQKGAVPTPPQVARGGAWEASEAQRPARYAAPAVAPSRRKARAMVPRPPPLAARPRQMQTLAVGFPRSECAEQPCGHPCPRGPQKVAAGAVGEGCQGRRAATRLPWTVTL